MGHEAWSAPEQAGPVAPEALSTWVQASFSLNRIIFNLSQASPEPPQASPRPDETSSEPDQA